MEQFTKISNGLKPVKTQQVNEPVSTHTPKPILKTKSSKFGVGFFIIMLVVLVVLFLFLGPLGLGMGIIGSAMIFVVKSIIENKNYTKPTKIKDDPKPTVNDKGRPVIYFINGSNKGKTVELRQGRTVIGSTDNNDIKVSGSWISRNHLAIHVDEENENFFQIHSNRKPTDVDSLFLS